MLPLRAQYLPAVLLTLGACRIERAASGRLPPPSSRDTLAAASADSAAMSAVEQALRSYYARFTARDWLIWSQSFWRGAIITTRWTPPGETDLRVFVNTVEEFVRRAPLGPGRLAVFSEELVRADIRAYSDLAQAWVVYRARFGMTADSVETHYGVDAFQLMFHQGEWRITSLTFTNEIPGQPLEGHAP